MESPVSVLIVSLHYNPSVEISLTTISQAGSGPSGLYLALALAQNGIKVRIIEKDKVFHTGSRGGGVVVCFFF